MNPKSENIVRIAHQISSEDRWLRNGHRGGILWFTGLSASGKSTLAINLETALHESGMQAYVLDGDNVRHGLCSDLGFSPDDRSENIRRVGELAQIMAEAGLIVITAFISPYRVDRDNIRARAGTIFHEIHIAAPMEICEARDPKGLYEKARAGDIPEFTGISAPYEEPSAPELLIESGDLGVDECVAKLKAYADNTFRFDASGK